MPLTLPLPAPRETARFDVVALGESSLDVVAELAGGAPTTSKQTLSSLTLRVGGQMATAAVGVARLGQRACYVGVLGDDGWGERVRAELAHEGVTVETTTRAGRPSRAAVILVEPDGDRRVLEYRHPDMELQPDEVPEACTAGRLLLVDATNGAAAVEAARRARARGIPTVVDADRVSPDTDALFEFIDVIVVPEPFIIEWAGVYDLAHGLQQMATRFASAVAVVATRGPAGAMALAGGQLIDVPGFAVDVADTTGAGDAFRAGLCAGWLRGDVQAELVQVLRFANATAALNCRAVGAQAGLPREAEVLALLNGGRG